MKKYILLFLSLSCFCAHGQYQIVDIKVGINSSKPDALVVLNNIVYFVAEDSINGRELWRSDGTVNGTYLLKDINIGIGSSDIYNLTVFKNKLVFIANDAVHGREIWTSDGSESGTKLLVEIINDNSSTSISDERFITFQNNFFFTATDGISGKELWISDGTETNTRLFWDKLKGPNGANPSILTVFNNKLYCYAYDSLYGRELWIIDGTDSGFQLLKDISIGNSNSEIANYIICNNQMYFVANDHINGSELWTTDGTKTGTYLVKDIYPGSKSSNISFLYSLDSSIVFLANDSLHGLELWQSDGTINGTKLLYDGRSGIKGQPNSVKMVEFKNKLIFNYTNDSIGNELYTSDLELKKIQLLSDIYSGSSSSNPNQFIIADSLFYFVATTQNEGAELKTFNGVKIRNLNEIYPGPRYDIYPEELVCIQNQILCFVSTNKDLGKEFYILNPNLGVSTFLLSDGKLNIYPNPISDILTCDFIEGTRSFLDYKIQLLESTGKVLGAYKFNVSGKCLINFIDFSQGNYIINVIDNNNNIILSKKVLKI